MRIKRDFQRFIHIKSLLRGKSGGKARGQDAHANALTTPDFGELGACHHRLPHGDSHPVAVLIGTGRTGANPVDNIRESGLYRHPFGCRIPRQRRPSDGV